MAGWAARGSEPPAGLFGSGPARWSTQVTIYSDLYLSELWLPDWTDLMRRDERNGEVLDAAEGDAAVMLQSE